MIQEMDGIVTFMWMCGAIQFRSNVLLTVLYGGKIIVSVLNIPVEWVNVLVPVYSAPSVTYDTRDGTSGGYGH